MKIMIDESNSLSKRIVFKSVALSLMVFIIFNFKYRHQRDC